MLRLIEESTEYDAKSDNSTDSDVDNAEALDTFDIETSVYPNKMDPTPLLNKDNRSPPTSNWIATRDRLSPAIVVKIKKTVTKRIHYSTNIPNPPSIFRPISPILFPISPTTSPRDRNSISPINRSRSKSQETKPQYNKPLTRVIFDFLKNHQLFFINILTFVFFSTFLTFLLLSIITPEIIEILFSPSLNIFQTQLIAGVGIFISIVIGIRQNKDYCFKNEEDDEDEDDNESQHDLYHGYGA